jgi:anthranilate synthase/aminodeoxychorismate synthase-like glutamine amidotransferase
MNTFGQQDYRVVIIDNYDSYAYNLFQGIGELTGRAATVVRNDETSLRAIRRLNPSHIVISPGPGNPENPDYFGVCLDVIHELGPTIPLLGVCLGHQGIGYAFGGHVVRAPKAMHGKTSRLWHNSAGVFRGVSNPCTVMRYHSLMVEQETFPSVLRVTAQTDDGVIMGLQHTTYPIWGVQFHPESIGTPSGISMLQNFLSARAELHVGAIEASVLGFDARRVAA